MPSVERVWVDRTDTGFVTCAKNNASCQISACGNRNMVIQILMGEDSVMYTWQHKKDKQRMRDTNQAMMTISHKMDFQRLNLS